MEFLEQLKDQVLELMKQKNYLPMEIDQLFEKLELRSSQDFTNLAKVLNQLEDEFIITHNSKGKFALLETFHLAKGVIDIKDAGYGFIDFDEGSIFIKKVNLKGALTNDEVLVSYFTDQLGRYEGKVERIIKRSNVEIVGKLQKYRHKFIVKSVNYRIDLWVFIKSKDLNKAQEGDMVKVKITRFFPNNTADGEIIEIIGSSNTPSIDITSLVINSGIRTDFSNEVKEEIKNIPQVVKDIKNPNRKDLRDKFIITIDGDDAKDLDDAVRVEKLSNGNYLLGVYIADVSEYVQELSALDLEGFERGTSVYLADRVIPMLPKELSNGICSLNPNVDRLVMSCEMEINSKGNVVEYSIFEALIKTTYRMTYNNVNKILEQDLETTKMYPDLAEMLSNMQELAQILMEMRKNRGSFNFETNEAKVLLDEKGIAKEIILRKRGMAEKIIEEFMLIANETVAQAMTWLDVPFIYRVHEEPKEEKIGKFIQILNNFNYKFKVKSKKGMSKALQQVLINLEEEDDEIAKTIINNTLLRSMMKAKYSEVNIGHYGLASSCYTHFTSPIRRYPDLLVHRLIKHYLLNEPQINSEVSDQFFMNKVRTSSLQASKCEKKAESLERDVLDMKKCEYMMQFTNHEFCGIISSVTNWGIYITLENTVEGLVRFEDLPDYYEVDELNARIIGRRYGQIYQMGDQVRVKVVDINLEKRQVTFKLLGRKE